MHLQLSASRGGLAILATALLPTLVLGAVDLTKSYKLEAETSPGHWAATKVYSATLGERLSILELVLSGPTPDQTWSLSAFKGQAGAYQISPAAGGTTLSDIVPGGAVTAWQPSDAAAAGTTSTYRLVLPGQSTKSLGVHFDAPYAFNIGDDGTITPPAGASASSYIICGSEDFEAIHLGSAAALPTGCRVTALRLVAAARIDRAACCDSD